MSHDNGTGGICPSSTDSPPAPRFHVPPDGSRHRALTRLRAWKRGWCNGRGRWAKLYADTIAGALYLDRLHAGRVRPYELGDVGHALYGALSRDAVAMLTHILGAEKAFGARGGVRLGHKVTAELLGKSRRHAGDVMRELVTSGLVEVRWHFHRFGDDERPIREGGGTRKHDERTPAYSTTARCTEVIAKCLERSRRTLVGKNCQPSGIKPSLTRGPKRSSGAGRPEQAFVEGLLRSRGPKREPAGVATVIERRSDGSVALGSQLTADTVAQRLRRAEGIDDATAAALNAAWRAFEKNGGGAS